MDTATAELAKYAANTFLVTKISFMNEIAQICERVGANVDMLRQAIGYDSRIGHKFLYPGIGYGGSCFPKDVRALQKIASDNDYDFKLLSAAMTVNLQQHHSMMGKISDHFDGDVAGKTFALWGLSFKPNTDDIRDAPSLAIIEDLLAVGAKVIAYDPEARHHVRGLYANNDNVKVVEDKYDALNSASALVIATEWAEFVEADIEKIKHCLSEAVIFDGRNIYQPADMEATGFSYYSVGRRPVIQY
jgi:UDPglucose 6-dehydrogenase